MFFAMSIVVRLRKSLRPAAIHLACGLIVACTIAALLFFIWYPSPYDEFSGGRNLFLLLIGVDVGCGPLLTLLLVTDTKPRRLLVVDITLVLLIQAAAMTYGMHVAWQARPIYLVAEVDRFKVITIGDLEEKDVRNLPPELRSGFWKKPLVVGIRPPISVEEKNKVLFESIKGGRDYAERPEFYISYGAASAKRSLEAGKRFADFIHKYPALQAWANNYAAREKISIDEIKYLPVMAREDWIALIDEDGYIAEFLKGEGFL